MIPVQRYEQRLRTRLAELTKRLEGIEHDLDEAPDADVEERATEREDDEVLENLGVAGLMEVRMIRAALARIDAGDYGVCVNCGEEIAGERLDVVPHAPRCRNCA